MHKVIDRTKIYNNQNKDAQRNFAAQISKEKIAPSK